MKYQERIIMFMKLTNKLILSYCPSLKDLYMNELLEQDILSWDNETARQVWNKLTENINSGEKIFIYIIKLLQYC